MKELGLSTKVVVPMITASLRCTIAIRDGWLIWRIYVTTLGSPDSRLPEKRCYVLEDSVRGISPNATCPSRFDPIRKRSNAPDTHQPTISSAVIAGHSLGGSTASHAAKNRSARLDLIQFSSLQAGGGNARA